MSAWIVERRRVVARGSLYGRTQPTFTWERDARFGEFASRADAKCAAMLEVEPALAGSSQAFIVRHFDQLARNERTLRVRRVRRDAA